MTTSEKRRPTDSSHDSDGLSVAESSQSDHSLSGDGPNTARRRFSVRSLPEALAVLDIAADHHAAAYGMVAKHRCDGPTLEEMAMVEIILDAARRCLGIFTALAAHTKAGDTAYAAAVLRFGMTGRFPEESGDTADRGESCS